MAEAGNIAKFRRLSEIRGIKARLNDQALAEAQTREAEAREQTGQSRQRSDDAYAVWADCIGAGAFEPDDAARKAALSMERDRQVERAAAEQQAAALATADRAGAKLRSDGELRMSKRIVRDARRAADKKREARALDALADRTTVQWRRK